MKHLRKINESSNKEYLLITYTESGDEIHFLVLDYSYNEQIQEFMANFENRTQQDIEDILNTIYDNKEAKLMCQTFVLEDFSRINKYNIVKCINLPLNGL